LRALLPFSLGYFISYLLRAVNQVIAPDLIAEFDLDQGELGQLTAAYLLAFMLFQLPLGVLLDRFGPRVVQIGLLFVAAIGVGLFSVSDSVWQLTLARGIIGLGLSGCLMACFKANALWMPMARIPLANSSAFAMGALGLVVSTEPADWLARQIGWREMFWWLAGAIAVIAIIIALVAPKGGGRSHVAGRGAQILALRGIFVDRKFWRIAPMVAAVSGAYISIQSLWAGRWLADVSGMSREDAANVLLWMAVAFAAGSFSTGLIADTAQRFGIGLRAVVSGAFAIFVTAQLLIVFIAPVSPYLCWILFGFSGQAANLPYATLAHHFGRELAGRAQTAANLVLFLTATAIQWGIGIALDYFPATEIGTTEAIGYQAVFAAVLVIQVLAFSWYATERERKSS